MQYDKAQPRVAAIVSTDNSPLRTRPVSKAGHGAFASPGSAIQSQTSAVMKPPSVMMLRCCCSGTRGRGRIPERRIPPMSQDGLCLRRQSPKIYIGLRGGPWYAALMVIGVSVCVPTDGILEPEKSEFENIGVGTVASVRVVVSEQCPKAYVTYNEKQPMHK